MILDNVTDTLHKLIAFIIKKDRLKHLKVCQVTMKTQSSLSIPIFERQTDDEDDNQD